MSFRPSRATFAKWTGQSKEPATRTEDGSDEQKDLRFSNSLPKSSSQYGEQQLPVQSDLRSVNRWRPKSLRKRTLLLFAVVFAALAITLGALYSYSNSNQGICSVDLRLHYLWTYAPTLVFTIIGACWARVHYRILQMQPWRMLHRHGGNDAQALLTDYVTPISIVALAKALKARHFLVIGTLLATMLLQLVTIISTALFDTQYITVQRNGNVMQLDTLGGLSQPLSAVEPSPVLTIYGIQNTGLTLPEGTTMHHAVPRLSYQSAPTATLTAPLDVFSTSLQCEEASLTVQNITQIGEIHFSPQFNYSLASSSCSVDDLSLTGGAYLDYNIDMNQTIIDSWGFAQLVTCSDNSSKAGQPQLYISAGLILYNIIFNVTHDNDTDPNPLLTLNQRYQILNSTNLLCSPSFGTQSSMVTYSTNSTSGSRQIDVSSNTTSVKRLDDTASQNILSGIMASLVAAMSVMDQLYPNPNQNAIMVNGPSEGEGGYFPTHNDAFFITMTQQYPPSNGSARSDFWFDPTSLQNLSSQFFGSVAAQFASQYLRKEANNVVPASVTVVEPRLVVFTAAFGLAVGLLGVLYLAALCLTWSATGNVTPIDPASIGGVTAMVGPRPHLTRPLQGTGPASLPLLKQHLLNDSSSISSRRLNSNDYSSIQQPGFDHNDASWWRPWVLRPVIREIVLLVPLAVIAALEITLHFSQKNDGLAYIGSHRHRLYGSRVVPATVFFSISKIFDSMAFNVSLMTPFSTVRSRPTAAHIGLFDAPLAQAPIQNFWISIRKRQLALFCSVLMTTAAFFLVTVSSGLFVLGSGTKSANLTQVAGFHFDSLIGTGTDSDIHNISQQYNLTEPFHYAEDDGEVRVHLVANSIIELNLSYPIWTYNDLALPLITTSNASASDLSQAVSVLAQLPAARVHLECEVLQPSQINLTYSHYVDGSYVTPYYALFGIIGTNTSCGGDTYEGEGEQFSMSVQLPSGTTDRSARPVSYMHYNCDVLYGLYTYVANTKAFNTTMIACQAAYQHIQANVTFDLPGYAISTSHPPVVNEATMTLANQSDIGSFLEATGDFVATSISSRVFDYNTTDDYGDPLQLIDPITTALIGAYGLTYDQIFNQDPSKHTIPALTRMVKIMGAQYISYFYRTAAAGTPSVGRQHAAKLQMGDDYRLRQSVVSTRILDALLALSWIFAVIIVYFSFRSRDVVKAELGTLAVTIALVADSEFLREVCSGIRDKAVGMSGNAALQEKMKDGDVVLIERKLRTQGYQFSLGWWTDARSRSSSSLEVKRRRRWGLDVGRADA